MNVKKVMLTLVFIFLAVPAFADEPVILVQPDSPITITTHKAYYFPNENSILHKLKYKNVSDKEIVAIKFRLVDFDVFNNFLDTMIGWTIESFKVGKEKEEEWQNRTYRAFTFDKYGTGVAYVYAVRFADGTFWYADKEQVLAQLRKFEATLNEEDLEEKKEDTK